MIAPKTYNPPVTARGNKDKDILYTYLDPEIKRRFNVQAAIEDKSMTEINEQLILEYLKKKEKERG